MRPLLEQLISSEKWQNQATGGEKALREATLAVWPALHPGCPAGEPRSQLS